MRLLKIALTGLALLAASVASAQSVTDADAERLSPAVVDTPREPTANERLCAAAERYAAHAPNVSVAVRGTEQLQTVDLANLIHRQLARVRVAQALLQTEHAAGRSLTPDEALATVRALPNAELRARLLQTFGLDREPSSPLQLVWSVAFPLRSWCTAARTGRRIRPFNDSLDRSLQGRFCSGYDLGGFGTSDSLSGCPSAGVNQFGPSLRQDSQVINSATGRPIDLSMFMSLVRVVAPRSSLRLGTPFDDGETPSSLAGQYSNLMNRGRPRR